MYHVCPFSFTGNLLSFPYKFTEGSHSGLVHHLGKVAGSKGPREFESLTLRLGKISINNLFASAVMYLIYL